MCAGLINKDGNHPVVLVCEHASYHIPDAFDNLGLSKEHLKSHIAWDIGAFETAKALSAILNAKLVYSDVSRLIYDCNRPPSVHTAIPSSSENIDIPGNQNLSDAARCQRIDNYYRPFERLLANVLTQSTEPPILTTVHSFTPVHLGEVRTVEIGILHDDDRRLADAILDVGIDYKIKRNKPYGPADGVTHTLKQHALPHNLLNVMIEIRNDLIQTPQQCKGMAEKMADWLITSMNRLAIAPHQDVLS